MPQKLETVLKHVEELSNEVNRQIIQEYYNYLVFRDTSTIYQKDNVKLILMFAKFIGESKSFYDVKDSETIVAFLDTRRKSKEEDELSEIDVDVLCDASEDYEAHKEQCDKLYDSVEENATFASSEEEEHCEDNDGNWSKEDKECKFDDEDDQEEYDEKKYKHFANKPENQGRGDWEYDEEDS